MMNSYKRTFVIISILLSAALSGTSVFSQENQTDPVQQSADTLNAKIEKVQSDLNFLKKLKISGYVQAQWQWADSNGIGSAFSGGPFPPNTNNRFMVRRGYVKLTYSGKLSKFVVQIDATEKGVRLKDAYVNLKDPWMEMFTIQAGVFNRPFGFEVGYSSSKRESPERARITQSLFPQERDLGVMLTIQPNKESGFHFFRLNAALVNGNGIALDTDSKKDFIGQLGINKSTSNDKFRYAVGVSYYNGGVFQDTKYIYNMFTYDDGSTKGFMVDSTASNLGEYAKREYFGVDAQLSLDWDIGVTSLRGEYLWGSQPGVAKLNISPAGRIIPLIGVSDTYNRSFNGAYVYLIQNILHSRHEIVIKYDFLDPNTKVKGREIIAETTVNDKTIQTSLGIGDIRYSTWGFGYNVGILSNLKLMVFYEFVMNEETAISGYSNDVEDDVFTLRAQFKF